MTRFRSQWWRFGARPYRARRSPSTDAAMARFWSLAVAMLIGEAFLALVILGAVPYGHV